MKKSKVQITGKTKEVLDAITGYIDEHGYSPSIREIGEMTGLKSTSSVHVYTDRLFQLGELQTDLKTENSSTDGAPRAFRLKVDSKEGRKQLQKENRTHQKRIEKYEGAFQSIQDNIEAMPENMKMEPRVKAISKAIEKAKT